MGTTVEGGEEDQEPEVGSRGPAPGRDKHREKPGNGGHHHRVERDEIGGFNRADMAGDHVARGAANGGGQRHQGRPLERAWRRLGNDQYPKETDNGHDPAFEADAFAQKRTGQGDNEQWTRECNGREIGDGHEAEGGDDEETRGQEASAAQELVPKASWFERTQTAV